MACELSLEQIIEATGGKILSSLETHFNGVGTDTRADLSGQIFIALVGENHDAHKFLNVAVEKGAKCLIIQGEPQGLTHLLSKVTIVQVRNTLTGLQDLARYWRKKIKAKVVAITGSNGKTTTKEFCNSILSSHFKLFASHKSFNNHWGVPLTLLGISKDIEVAIVEMGMNHTGELSALSKIASPDIVVCTMVGRAHIGNFANGQQGVADAKEEIYLANPQAIQIFNYDNEYTNKMFQRVHKLLGTERVRVFSNFSAGAEVSLRANTMTLEGMQVIGHIKGIKGEAQVAVFGRQNIVNLMAASSIAASLKMEPEQIWLAMKNCKTGWGRNQLIRLPNGTQVLFDGYNANPDSVTMLIKNFFEIQCQGKKIVVLGEMLELGTHAEKAHAEIGEMISNTDVELVWFYGPSAAAFERGFHASGTSKILLVSNTYEETLAKKVQAVLNPSDIVVMKASRGMQLERVLKCWDPSFKTQY